MIESTRKSYPHRRMRMRPQCTYRAVFPEWQGVQPEVGV